MIEILFIMSEKEVKFVRNEQKISENEIRLFLIFHIRPEAIAWAYLWPRHPFARMFTQHRWWILCHVACRPSIHRGIYFHLSRCRCLHHAFYCSNSGLRIYGRLARRICRIRASLRPGMNLRNSGHRPIERSHYHTSRRWPIDQHIYCHRPNSSIQRRP